MATEVQIPDDVIKALAEVRETGLVNMIDRRGVMLLIGSNLPAWDWLNENRNLYMDALNAMGRSLKHESD